MGQPAPGHRRARTDAQKEQRRGRILDEAEAYFRESGFDAFSVAELARRAGLAKGTLYLYFESREAVLLALHGRLLQRQAERLCAGIGATMEDLAFARLFLAVFKADAALLELMLRLEIILEHNVATDTLVSCKRGMMQLLAGTAAAIAPPLGLDAAQATDALQSLSALLLGTSRGDAGPCLDPSRFPPDLQRFLASFDSTDLFIRNACRVLGGVRTSGPGRPTRGVTDD